MLATLLTALLAGSAPAPDCHIGAYRLSDGSAVDVAPTDGDALRWRRIDGSTGKLSRGADDTWTSTFGWTDRPDGKTVRFTDCAKGKLSFGDMQGERMPLVVKETTFTGDGGTKLVGRLILPPGHAKVPVVVLVHGAEHTSAMQRDAMQREFPAEGVAAFVYDKRGTGASGGEYTQDYSVLANDAVAAMAEARRLAGDRAGRAGYRGGSQGGWVAPLAATRTKVDFVIVGYGLAVSALQEDREAVALELTLKGYDQSVIDKAWELSDAIGEILSSNLTKGFDKLDAAKAKYAKEPWYKDVHGNFSYMVLPMSDDEIREKGKAYMAWNVPWSYDAMPVLEKLQTPQLWELGEDDIDAPSAETLRRLASLQAKGRPITTALFPHAEHGMTEYEMKDGERVSTRYSAGYMQMTIDYAKGALHPPYGASKIAFPSPAPAK